MGIIPCALQSASLSADMGMYTALPLECLALQTVLRASLPTSTLAPRTQGEVATWARLEGSYRVWGVAVEVERRDGGPVSEELWEWGSTRVAPYWPGGEPVHMGEGLHVARWLGWEE